MARLLVAGPRDSLPHRQALDRLVERLRRDGHDAAPLPPDGALAAVEEADGLVAFLDGRAPDANAVAAAVLAHARGKPVLALHGGQLSATLAGCAALDRELRDDGDLFAALDAYYAKVRPFAGRLVRDGVPALVRQAGHEVRFRELAAEERPRFLKRKISEEARELEAAPPGDEPEEVADLLEALEAFLRARAFDRDQLRKAKEEKRRVRGGFERGFVVESTAGGLPPAADGPPADGPREPLLREL